MDSSDAIAVIGMSVRFPGAPDYAAFWQNLRSGIVSITYFTPKELTASGVSSEDIANPFYVPAKPIIEGIDQFDAGFFGFSDRDAALTDPQQRIFLETAWEAFEDAGYEPCRNVGRIGVFAGVGKNTYLLRNLLAASDWPRSPEVFQLLIGNEKDYLATRVAHVLDATGPAFSVQTACSSSLVAVHLACQSLLAGECDFALAGGVSIDVPVIEGYWHHPRGILSSDGQCHPFTSRAAGTIFGHGSAAIVLRRQSDANRDTIRALVRGSAVNNDGRRSSFSAPSETGQATVVIEALAVGSVSPSEIGYVEAHGTATAIGDAIEIRALERSFRQASGHRIAVGSVKANIGHTGAASGIAGLCKTILSRQHGQILPNPHALPGDPTLGEPGSPLFLNSTLREWPPMATCAGVSSFGQGGTNVHVVVDAAPPLPHRHLAERCLPFVLSARSSLELDLVTERLLRHLE
ncbi:MAG TPA: polyketide synthase, partial [Gemmata sp.]|nr:polyketide synthase [Gemmata sp.]